MPGRPGHAPGLAWLELGPTAGLRIKAESQKTCSHYTVRDVSDLDPRAANFANVINANAEKENVEIKQEAKRRIQGDQEELGFFFLF